MEPPEQYNIYHVWLILLVSSAQWLDLMDNEAKDGGWFPRWAVTHHHPSTHLGSVSVGGSVLTNPTVRKWINQQVQGTAGQKYHHLKRRTACCYKAFYFLSPFRNHTLLHP